MINSHRAAKRGLTFELDCQVLSEASLIKMTDNVFPVVQRLQIVPACSVPRPLFMPF